MAMPLEPKKIIVLVARAFGLAMGLVASLLTMSYATFVILYGAQERSGDSLGSKLLGAVLISLPFLFSSGIVYLCFSSNTMPVRQALGFRVRLRALFWTFLAELAVFALMVVMMSRVNKPT
jgi:hypothetical protein